MKSPYKIIGLLIIAAAIAYAAWPKDTVKDHNPMTGEGAPREEHTHDHLEPPPVPSPKEGTSIIPEDQGTGK